MSAFEATLTSKGQMTLPAELRRLWKLKPGDQIEFFEDRSGRVHVRPLNAAPTAFLEKLPARKRAPHMKSDNDAVAAAVQQRNKRSKMRKSAA